MNSPYVANKMRTKTWPSKFNKDQKFLKKLQSTNAN